MDLGKRRLNTGVTWLDQLLTKYHPGDNVLWCAAAGTHVQEFLRSSLEAAADDDRLIVYLSFERPPMDVRRELGDLSHRSSHWSIASPTGMGSHGLSSPASTTETVRRVCVTCCG